MEKNIFSFILKHSKFEQLFLLFLTLVSFPFLYASLELPKLIINEAIGGYEFPVFLDIPFYSTLELNQLEYLLSLCFIFLFLVLVNGVFKYTINVFKGQLGERILLYLRLILYRRILRFPLPHFKKVQTGETISIITAEVEPLGGFIGDAYVLPLFQGGTLLVYIGFIFAQDPLLGLAAISLYPFQLYIIPKLQRQVNNLAKERIKNVRRLSSQIGETMAGIQDVHNFDTTWYEQEKTEFRLTKIFNIRFKLFKKKFFIKFLNNFLAQLTPFFFYSIGGYLVIDNQLTSGALVAVIAAYKDLSSPWKELLTYYQQKEDVKIKYKQIIKQFDIDKLIEDEKLSRNTRFHIESEIQLKNLSLTHSDESYIIRDVSNNFDIRNSHFIYGTVESGLFYIPKAMANLISIKGKSIFYDKKDITKLPESVTGRQVGYVSQNSHIFSGTIQDNLFYGLKNRNDFENHRTDSDGPVIKTLEELETDNNNWINLKQADLKKNQISDHAVNILKLTELDIDIYKFGLKSKGVNLQEGLKQNILKARKRFAKIAQEKNLIDVIEPFEHNKYNLNATVLENLIFGASKIDTYSIDKIHDNSSLIHILSKHEILESLILAGFSAASLLIEIFSTQEQQLDTSFIEKYSFIDIETLNEIKPIVLATSKSELKTIGFDNRSLFLKIALQLIPAKHRFGLIDEKIQKQVILARQVFMNELTEERKKYIHFFDKNLFNPLLTIQDNILFGRIAYNIPNAEQVAQDLLEDVISSLNLKNLIIKAGLLENVGTFGGYLTDNQKQKLAISRSLLPQPKVLIIDQAFDGFDKNVKERIQNNILQNSSIKLICFSKDPDSLPLYDKAWYFSGNEFDGVSLNGDKE